MANKRHKPEEIVTKLRQVEVLVGQGMARIDAIREIGVVEQTYYRWRKLYGGMGRDQVKEKILGRTDEGELSVQNIGLRGEVGWSIPCGKEAPAT